MHKSSDETTSGLEDLTEAEYERATRANETYREVFEENGIAVAFSQNFEGWNEYLDGRIGDLQLADKAKIELEHLAANFGKYIVVEKKEDARQKKAEDPKKQRARQANKIYRQVCEEAGVKVYFFHDFASWSDYVEGKISEAEFRERARSEVQKIAA